MTHINRLGAVLSLLLTLASCGGGSDTPNIEQVTVVPFDAVVDGIWPVGQYIFRTDAEWQAAWDARGSSAEPPAPTPIVDFQRFVLVGFSAGMSGGCKGLRVNNASRLSNAYAVQYEVISAPPTVACGGVASHLLAFILLPTPVDSVRSELIFAGSH